MCGATLRPLAGREATDPLGDRRDVLGRRPAAPADDRDAVALDEGSKRRGERPGLLGKDRLAVRPLERQAGVGDAVHRHGTELAEEADRVAHVLGAGRAVEPDHVDPQCLERRERRADVGSEQHRAALGQEGHAGLDRHRPARELERLASAEDRRLELEHVLRGLDDDQVDATVHEPVRLLGEHLEQLAEGDLTEGRVLARGEESGRTDRAGYEPLLTGRLAGDLGCLDVDLAGVVLEAPFGELQSRGLEGVGLEHLGAGVEHRGVDAFDHVGSVQDERLVAAAGEPVVVLEAQIELLERRPHAAVEDDDAIACRGKIVAHCPANPSSEMANLDMSVARLWSRLGESGGAVGGQPLTSPAELALQLVAPPSSRARGCTSAARSRCRRRSRQSAPGCARFGSAQPQPASVGRSPRRRRRDRRLCRDAPGPIRPGRPSTPW